jgi:uncharacterized protein with gpF-like domain
MAYPLAAMARRNGKRRTIVLRDIAPPATLATDLYRSCYLPILSLWQTGSTAIVEAYSVTIAEMQTDSPADIEGEIDQLAEAMRALILTLTPQVRDWALRVEQWHRVKWRGAVLSATGVDLSTFIGPEAVRETLQARIAANVALIKDVGAQVQSRISQAVFRGLTERKTARDVAKEIREAVEMGRKRSINIASDQLAKLSGELSDERRREAGLDVWAWQHSGKRHPREEHRARDGLFYSEVKARQGKTVDGQRVLAPPPPNDWPSRPPFCGCRSRGVLVLE